MKSRGWAALAAALVVLAPLRAGRADDATDPFKAHVQAAKVHYDLGEFDDAAEEYILAYRIKPIAGALFNIAQAYRQAGKYDKSRQFYRSYLREANPDAKGKAAVEKQIRELDELIAKEDKTKNSAPTGVVAKDELAPPAPSAPEKAKAAPAIPAEVASSPAASKAKDAAHPSVAPAAPAVPARTISPTAPTKIAIADSHPKPLSAPAPAPAPAPVAATRASGTVEAQQAAPSHTLAYVTGGVAVALLGGGAFFGVQAARADNELTAGAHERADADALISTSKSSHMLSAVFLVAGGVAAVGAGLLYFLPASGPSGGSGVAVAGHF